MAPIHSRQLLVWTLPTIAALLSYLWYKKKRIGAPSDPGDKEASTRGENNTTEIKKSASVLGSSVTASQQIVSNKLADNAPTTPVKSFSRSLSGVESSPIDIIMPKELRSSRTAQVVISDEDLDLEIEKVKSMKNSNPIEEFQKAKKNKVSSPTNNNESKVNNFNVEVSQNSNLSSPASSSSPVEEKIVKIEMAPLESKETVMENTNVPVVCKKVEVTQSSPLTLSAKALSEVEQIIIAEATTTDKQEGSDKKTDVVNKEVPKVNGVVVLNSPAGSSSTPLSQVVAKGMKINARPFECKKTAPTKINSVPAKSNGKKKNKNKNNMSQKDIAVVGEKLNTLKLQDASDSKGAKKKIVEKNKNGKSRNSNREEMNRQSSERDSANHSPTEAMMASHSLSSISDDHSEGSNDSGKGCSDVATPPPSGLTRAGGGELNIISMYDFVIPQNLVGKLIGKHGAFVTQVNNKTNAQVVVKRHPNDDRLKVCTVEGTRGEVEKALKMIRERFPLKKFPEVTLDRVTLTHPVPNVPLVSDHLYLKLVAGINNDTIMSCMVTPNHLFLQQPTHPTFPNLNLLTNYMNICYSSSDSPLLPSVIPENTVCAAYSVDSWYRAMVLSTDPETETSYVKFLDYGGFAYVQNSMLRQIRGDFMLLPFQAAECFLANVKPIGDNWHEDAYNLVADLTKGSLIYTQVIEYAEGDLPLVHCYVVAGPQHLIFLNQELVNRGFAEWVSFEEEECDTACGTTLPQEFAQEA